jgi:hypothetical protein
MTDSLQSLSPSTEKAEKPKRSRRIKCDDCGQNYVEKKGDICPGCDAYREHTGHF